MSVDPAVEKTGPDFVMARSALPVMDVVFELLLLPDAGSPVVDETVAVLVMLVPAALGAMVYVDVIVAVCPFVSVPSAQG